MAERTRPKPSDIRLTMYELGMGEDVQLVHAYRLYHRQRQVFRVVMPNGDDQVLKVRRKDKEGITEADKITRLVASDRYLGGHFPSVTQVDLGDRIAIRMPFLGFNLSELVELMDLQTMGYEPGENDFAFNGFKPAEIEALIKKLRDGHLKFAASNGIIHGDIIQGAGPNNIVYHPVIRRLFLVDGEALAPLTDETEARFTDGIEQVREWAYTNLERL